ncbi:EF-P 5-aminopentanol modification-associated protein YfmF [Leuconostoc miyukkimchii]|uniref:EF-P 5-aminopentanol modification-associated protein YfmF n=1 Tax=Leuconostoc miyukkimchii TaxID=910540 RepID=UPI001C7CC276|nr:pitrilysin family protein [Leuconostoc miyukkimchii]
MKKIKIKNGVNLVVLPTTQFKTLHIAIDFAAPLEIDTVSARSLLTYLTAVSSKKYPNQQKVAQKTIDLYGAQYQTDVLRFGQTHHVRYSLQMPAPTYIDTDGNLLHDAFEFLHDMIFDPLVRAEQFDQNTFEKEQQSLMNELASLSDDKQRYAASKLRELTYAVPAMAISSSGRVNDVKELTSKRVYQAYEEMLANDTMNIIVYGDVDETRIISELKSWPLLDHHEPVLQPFYRQNSREILAAATNTQADINQAILMIAYRLAIAPDDPQRFVALVMNAMFGGSPLSKLFMNVREKESLAYSIYSRWQNDTGFITVAVGLDSEKIQQTESMIQAQLSAIQDGDFSEETLLAIKASLINDYLSQQDSPNSEIALIFSRLLTNRETSVTDWVNAVNAVTSKDVAALAHEVTIQSRFTLMPEA